MRTHVKIVADSLSPQGKRIVSIELVYPRIIHAEVMTHRVFSRNAASSRAIPTAKLIQSVKDDPFIPIAFQKKHSGMQGNEYLTGEDAEYAAERWLKASRSAIEQVQLLTTFHGVTKQLANRILEPFQYYKVLVTSTEWENFFELRCPKYKPAGTYTYRSKKDALLGYSPEHEQNPLENWDTLDWLKCNESQADIHISELAEKIWDAMNESIPKQLKAGEWHIPYSDDIRDSDLLPYLDYTNFDITQPLATEINLIKVKIATARAARVSYTVVDGVASNNYNNDIELHNRLLESKHMSPFEHCARAMSDEEYHSHACGLGYAPMDEEGDKIYFNEPQLGWCRNFRGFIQYRGIAEGVPTEFDHIGEFE